MEGNDGYYSPENLATVDPSIIDDMVTRILTPLDRCCAIIPDSSSDSPFESLRAGWDC